MSSNLGDLCRPRGPAGWTQFSDQERFWLVTRAISDARNHRGPLPGFDTYVWREARAENEQRDEMMVKLSKVREYQSDAVIEEQEAYDRADQGAERD